MTAYYQPSGRYSLGGVVALVLAGVLAAVPLAFAYVYAVWYIPFLYINFVFTLVLGFGIGWVLKTMTRAGKLRNPALAGWLGFALGLWTWYVQWCVYLTLQGGAGETEQVGSRFSITHTTFQPELFVAYLLNPDKVLSALPAIAADGTWGVFGITVSGFFLYLIWLAEFLIIMVAASMLPNSQAASPFSERSQEWAEKKTLPQSAAPFLDAAATKAALEAADWAHLQVRAAEDGPTAPFGRLHFYQAPADPECCFLSLENVTIEVDKNGKPSEQTTEVVEYLRVPPHVCTELHQRFGNPQPLPQDAASYTGTFQ